MGRCIKEMELDLRDHAENGTIYKRNAARGIIRHGDKYLAIHGKYGDYKFPGGGMEPGESLPDTLVREVREETGYRVVLESIGDYLLVHEKRNGNPDDWTHGIISVTLKRNHVSVIWMNMRKNMIIGSRG